MEDVQAASAEIVCTGGHSGVPSVIAGMIIGQSQIHTTRHTRRNQHGHYGANGTSPESRNIGAGAGYLQTKSDILSGSDFDIPAYCEKQRNAIAKLTNVPVENVEIISRKEYEQNTEE